MRLLTLTEYQPTAGIELAPDELHGLRRMTTSITIAPSAMQPGLFDLTPASWIGTINLGTLALEIRPKLPIDRVLFLLSYALDPKRWRDIPFAYGERASLVEAIIPGFVHQVKRAFTRGLLQGYRIQEDALATIRGRVRFEDQVRAHCGLLPPIEVRYDEFTEDIEENRLIKAAIERLSRLRIHSDASRHALRTFDGALTLVSRKHYDVRQLPEIQYTRLNGHYRPAVELAKLILRATSYELGHGGIQASTFLVDMNAVFEDFMVAALREALGVSVREFPQGMRGRTNLYLDTARAIRLEPDISWWGGKRCLFVGDIKYKRIDAAGILHPDLYQLLAYTIATGLPEGLLIYASGEDTPVVHEVIPPGKRLHVLTVDLRGTPDDILAQVRYVATSIRRLSLRSGSAARAVKPLT